MKVSTSIAIARSVAIFVAMLVALGCGGSNNSRNVVGTLSSGTDGNGGSSGNSGGGGSSNAAQFLYVANAGSSSISGFQINGDGTLTALSGFPVPTSVPAEHLSVAKSTLLLGGSDNSGAHLGLYGIDPASGGLTLKSSTDVVDPNAVLLPSAQFVYAPSGTPSVSGSVTGFATGNGALSVVAGSPNQFAISGGSNPVTAQMLLVDPAGKFLDMPLTLQNQHTPSAWFGVAAINPDGSLSNFNGNQAGCITAGGMAAVPQNGSTLVFSSCVDQWNGTFWISAISVDQKTGTLTDLGAAWRDQTNTQAIHALAVDPSGKWLAGVDTQNDTVHVMAIGPNGSLTDASDHDFPSGTKPVSVVFDLSGRFMYVANSGSNDVSAYAFDPNTGLLAPLPGSPYPVGQRPSALAIAHP